MDPDRPLTRWRRGSTAERPNSRSLFQPDRPKSRRGTTFQEEIEKARMRPPTSIPKTYNTYIGTGTAIFQPDKIPMGLQPQNRHVSQARLSTGKTVRLQPERMVRDKKYFEGLLKLKINQLTTEVNIMNENMEKSAKESGAYYHYQLKAMVKDLASNLTELQGRLADHNVALQKVNVGSDPSKTLAEAREIASANAAEELALEALFSERIRWQESSTEIQNQLNKEKFRTEQLIENMNSNLKQRYNELLKRNSEIQKKSEEFKKEIDSLSNVTSVLGDQVYVSPLKLELYEAELKLWDLEMRKKNIKLESEDRIKSEEDYDAWLEKLRNDNVERAMMEKSVEEIKEQIKETENALIQLDEKKYDENRNVRHGKYLELRKRELAMDDFLHSVENHKEDELNKLKALDAQIIPILKSIAESLDTVPTAADYNSIRQTQSHVAKSDLLNTMKSVGIELRNLYHYAKKLSIMDTKVENDLSLLKEKVDTMKNEIDSFTNTNELENKITKKKDNLLAEKDRILQTKSTNKAALKLATAKFNQINKQLSENEKYVQILFMEKKLSAIAQSNHTISEFIEEAVTDESLEDHRKKALNIMERLNENLKISLFPK